MSPIRSKNRTSLAIGERHLPIESTVASRSTDVMMAANQTTNNNSIMSILDKEKLNGSNFLDWYRNLRIVLRNEQKFHRLEEALPEALPLQLLLFAMPTLVGCYTTRSSLSYAGEHDPRDPKELGGPHHILNPTELKN
ncbi:hypothetical protein Tco_0212669 [Tanacetum coccineum]